MTEVNSDWLILFLGSISLVFSFFGIHHGEESAGGRVLVEEILLHTVRFVVYHRWLHV